MREKKRFFQIFLLPSRRGRRQPVSKTEFFVPNAWLFSIPFKEAFEFSSLHKERNENNLFWAAVGLEVTADSRSDGRMWIKGGGGVSRAEWKLGMVGMVGIDESPIHRHPLSIDLSGWLRRWTVAQVI